MKLKVDVVQGFIGSGKTRFINNILINDKLTETTLVLQQEDGKNRIRNNKVLCCREEDLENYINKYNPEKIIIEANSFKDINLILQKIKSKSNILLRNISVLDCENFQVYYKNMKGIGDNILKEGDIIVLNNFQNSNKDKWITKKLKSLNTSAEILVENGIGYKKDNYSLFNYIIQILTIVLIGIIGYMCILNNEATILEKYMLTFISILVEGIPFILIGSLVSSLIQVILTERTLDKFIGESSIVSCLIAAVSGIIFPICDCGTIPIVRGLIKKRVSISAAITFMLAAPIVNPISIMATIYAFPKNYILAFYRIMAGILIAITVGLIMELLTKKRENILKDDGDDIDCDCLLCIENGAKIGKFKLVIYGMVDEFFKVAKFMIIGALVSTIIQSVFTTTDFQVNNTNSIILILSMIVMGFFLSVCSTSDAFIARGLVNKFPLYSVMGFLIVGPMLDIKNTIMLAGNFKMKFVIKLVITIFVVSMLYLSLFSIV